MKKIKQTVWKFDLSELIEKEWIEQKEKTKLQVYKLPKGPRMILPRYIKLEEDIAWAIGFFIAEGSKTYSGIGIANKEKKLIQKFKQTVEKYFHIDHTKWQVYIITPNKNVKKIRKKWSKVFQRVKMKIRFTKMARDDIIEIRINNVLLSIIFNKFVRRSLSKIILKKKIILSFMDGYEVGDGSVIQRKGCLYGIAITVKDRLIKNFLVRLLNKLYPNACYVRRTKECYEIGIRGIHNMTKIVLDGHFSSCKKQWKKLIRCYLNKQYVRAHFRYWCILKDNELSAEKIAKKSQRSYWSVRDALNFDKKINLIRTKIKKTPGKSGPGKKYYYLSKKGHRLIKILKEDNHIGDIMKRKAIIVGAAGRDWSKI